MLYENGASSNELFEQIRERRGKGESLRSRERKSKSKKGQQTKVKQLLAKKNWGLPRQVFDEIGDDHNQSKRNRGGCQYSSFRDQTSF